MHGPCADHEPWPVNSQDVSSCQCWLCSSWWHFVLLRPPDTEPCWCNAAKGPGQDAVMLPQGAGVATRAQPHGPAITSWGVRTSSSSHLHYFTVPRNFWDVRTLTCMAIFRLKLAAAVAPRWRLWRRLPAREPWNTRSASSSFISRVRWAILGVN